MEQEERSYDDYQDQSEGLGYDLGDDCTFDSLWDEMNQGDE